VFHVLAQNPLVFDPINREQLYMHLEFVISACLVLLYVITFIEDIYNYIPETNHVSRVYSVAAALYLLFLLNVILFRM